MIILFFRFFKFFFTVFYIFYNSTTHVALVKGTHVFCFILPHTCVFIRLIVNTRAHTHILYTYIHISVRTHIIITQVESSSCPNTDNFKLTEL